MAVAVVKVAGSHRLQGDWEGVDAVNVFLGQLKTRAFSPATVRAYAFDLLCFGRFCVDRRIDLDAVAPTDIFDWVDSQMKPPTTAGQRVVPLAWKGAAPASVNRRVAAVRSFFEHLVMRGVRATNPVPVPRPSSGLRVKARGVLGHLGPKRPSGSGRLVRQPQRLPEAVDPDDVAMFLADLATHRDRAMVLLMVLGGLRCAEVRHLRLADVDQGRRRVRVVGKGGKDRVVPVDRAFFAELAAYLRSERPPGLHTPECFVVLRGPTAGGAMTEAGVRSLFRRHRASSGATRVRPHRLRHTFGTELAAAGIDLVVLRDLMGHSSPETTALYVHLSDEHLAAEYMAARAGDRAMTAAVAREATPFDHPILDAYISHCEALGCRDRARRDRLRAARQFLAEHPDLSVWMDGPLPGRLVDLERTKAWPLIAFAVLAGRVAVDVDLLLAKDLGSFGVAAEQILVEDMNHARAAAERLGWAPAWTDTVVRGCLALILAWTTKPMTAVTVVDLDAFAAAVSNSPAAHRWTRRSYLARLHACRQLLYECTIIDQPPKRGPAPATLDERLAVIGPPELRRTIGRYIHTRAAVVTPKTIESIINDLIPLAQFLTDRFPKIGSVDQLERHHIEAFLTWNRTERTWRGRKARPQLVSDAVVHHTVITVRNFFDDLILWGWADAPRHQLPFATDIARPPRPLPRALPPDADSALMAAVADLDDVFARCAITICRRAGLRIGECLDLTLACVVYYGPTGSWLQVPLGKLATERSVPLDSATVEILDAWTAQRGRQRALPHPRTGKLTDFLFVERGHQLGPVRVRNALNRAAHVAGLTGVTPHRLRHTYGTELINAGMSLPALMALLGHVTPEMTLRYATLASPALRDAYDQAIGKLRRRIPVAPAGRAAIPDRVAWLHSEYLKTRLAAGYCSRHLTAEACPYANVCETCDNFTPTPEFAPVLADQLHDIRELHDDASQRGWTTEVDRHARVINDLETHLRRLGHEAAGGGSS